MAVSINFTNMEDEFTTKMHAELLGDEIPYKDLLICSVYGATKRGISLDDALKIHGISKEEYEQNIERVLNY